ncbi:MAG: hypothetical protein ABS36_01330 [Acidobacteria bacterium SCN 69-37]|nr:MAG: hypothetical protein ABS36_01330 [Acidobacteria bacterium SCN 69-37]
MRRWLVGLLLVTGCASAPLRHVDEQRLADADAAVRAGCHDCLVGARDTYALVASTRARPLVLTRLFETEVLIGLRDAELALSPDDAFARADALLPELPPDVDAAFLLALARAMPPDRQGTPRLRMRQGQRDRQTFAADHLDEVFTRLDASTAGLPFRNYLSAGVACLAPTVGVRSATSTVIEIPPDTPPLVRYRLATCPNARVELLEAVRTAVPDFVEAAFFQARVPTPTMTVARVADQRTAYTAAADRFPRSPAVLYSVAALHQTLGDCRRALEAYDALLAVEPDHEDGSLQRIVCLGYLGQHDEAIAAATRLIDDRFDNIGDAYYWRAWNHHKRERLPAARADIDRAMALRVNSAVLSLSGMIKYEQDAFDEAQRDLRGAVAMDPAQCIAQWYLGLVAFAREDWPATGAEFEAASSCYNGTAEQNSRELARIRDADLDADFKASQIAGFEAVIAEDRDQEQASYLNAANGYIRAAYTDKARVMLARIVDTSPHAAAARELSGYLDAIVGPVEPVATP